MHAVPRSETPDLSLVREKELIADSNGKQYVSPDDGYAISIPPGAIPEGKTITFKHGVVPDGPFGPFEFPDGVRPVSLILSLYLTTEHEQQPLLKLIDIALPHFIHYDTPDDQKSLSLFKACHNDFKVGRNGKPVLCFKKITNETLKLSWHHDQPYVKYSTDHCCYWCLGKFGKEDTNSAIFNLIEVKSKFTSQSKQQIVHFCLPYLLPTCTKV